MGLLLVSALMVVPVAAAQQVTRGFRVTLGLAMAIGTVAALGGISVSAFVDVPPGSTIVLLALAIFAAAGLVYLALSLPLAAFARWLGTRLSARLAYG